jgi:hypothetical protein
MESSEFKSSLATLPGDGGRLCGTCMDMEC